MGRKPKLLVTDDGDAIIRITLPRPLWLLCQHVANQFGFEPSKAVEMMLLTLGAHAANAQRGPQVAQLLGPVFENALREIRRENFGVIKSGPTIDLNKLHRSTRVKSGFEGVYASGQGFRAMGRDKNVNSMRYLGTFETAEEAAWHRYLYYSEQNLPYGQWELDVDAWRTKHKFTGSDAELIAALEQHNVTMGLEHLNELPGKPENPSTTPPAAQSVLKAEDDETPAQMIERMRAENDAQIAATAVTPPKRKRGRPRRIAASTPEPAASQLAVLHDERDVVVPAPIAPRWAQLTAADWRSALGGEAPAMHHVSDNPSDEGQRGDSSDDLGPQRD